MLKIYKNNISQDELINFFSNLDEKKNRMGQYLYTNNENDDEKKKFKIKTNFWKMNLYISFKSLVYMILI